MSEHQETGEDLEESSSADDERFQRDVDKAFGPRRKRRRKRKTPKPAAEQAQRKPSERRALGPVEADADPEARSQQRRNRRFGHIRNGSGFPWAAALILVAIGGLIIAALLLAKRQPPPQKIAIPTIRGTANFNQIVDEGAQQIFNDWERTEGPFSPNERREMLVKAQKLSLARVTYFARVVEIGEQVGASHEIKMKVCQEGAYTIETGGTIRDHEIRARLLEAMGR